MEKKKKLIILGVILLLIIVSGATFAILTWNSTMIKLGINTNCFTIDYTKGGDITGSLKLINEEDLISNDMFTIKEGIGLTGVNIGIKSSCSIEGYGFIYLNVNSISDSFTTGDSKGALKYAILSNTSSISNPSDISINSLVNQSFSIVKTGSITSSNTVTLLTKKLSNSEIYKYLVVIYVDNDLAGNSITSASFKGDISADANQGKMYFSQLITNDIFNPNTTVTSNSINYKYDTNNNLMEDIAGNIRYYGATPNNYVYFNCSDYSNQSDSTCEKWRIIGVFDGKVKLIRDESIGDYSWDNKSTSTGAESDYGKNDWTTARLMKLLNPSDYYTTDSNDNGNGQSLYWNSSSGTCFSGENIATKSCDFTSTGIKNDTTRNLIAEYTYNIGGWNTSRVYPDFIYEKERGTTVYSGRPTTWTGKIALMYPSDYGYAADLSLCKDANGNDFQLNQNIYISVNNYQCSANNYLYKGVTEWLVAPHLDYADGVWSVYSFGDVNYNYSANNSTGARPVLFLKSVQELESGSGTQDDPYKLLVK